jgi:hypothetical protein
MSDQQSSRMEQILDLLVEEIDERLWVRKHRPPVAAPAEPLQPVEELAAPPSPVEAEVEPPEPEPGLEAKPLEPGSGLEAKPLEPGSGLEAKPPEPGPELEARPPEYEPEEEMKPLEPEFEMELPPMVTGPSHASRLMGRLALGLLVAIVLINVPLNRHGTTLATAMPDSAALVITDGLVVTEEDDEEIYVYQDGKLRWISSLDAFEHFGYTWGDVRVVKDGFIDDFEMGSPLHVLLKCRQRPHIYRLEGGEKRWIRDIVTFTAEGHIWEDVRFVTCQHLRDIPDGETIPPGSGPPPQP